jgi:hypothetical protein
MSISWNVRSSSNIAESYLTVVLETVGPNATAWPRQSLHPITLRVIIEGRGLTREIPLLSIMQMLYMAVAHHYTKLHKQCGLILIFCFLTNIVPSTYGPKPSTEMKCLHPSVVLSKLIVICTCDWTCLFLLLQLYGSSSRIRSWSSTSTWHITMQAL